VLRTEGEDNGEWIIVDCGAAVAHIMQPAIREYYHLEEIWGGKAVRMKVGEVNTKLVKASEPEPAPKKAPRPQGGGPGRPPRRRRRKAAAPKSNPPRARKRAAAKRRRQAGTGEEGRQQDRRLQACGRQGASPQGHHGPRPQQEGCQAAPRPQGPAPRLSR
jgi:ribosome-associated protein